MGPQQAVQVSSCCSSCSRAHLSSCRLASGTPTDRSCACAGPEEPWDEPKPKPGQLVEGRASNVQLQPGLTLCMVEAEGRTWVVRSEVYAKMAAGLMPDITFRLACFPKAPRKSVHHFCKGALLNKLRHCKAVGLHSSSAVLISVSQAKAALQVRPAASSPSSCCQLACAAGTPSVLALSLHSCLASAETQQQRALSLAASAAGCARASPACGQAV